MCLITEVQKYMKQKLKGEIEKSTTRAGNFNTLIIDRTSRQKVSKNIEDLSNAVNQLDLMDICTTLHPTVEYTLSSRAHQDTPNTGPYNKSQYI